MRDGERGPQRLGVRVDQPRERRTGPAHLARRRLLANDPFALALIVAGPGQQPLVLHLMLGCLDDHGAGGVEPGPAGPTGDLMELARRELAHSMAVELRQSGEQNGADRHVDPHPEGVRATDHREQAVLGEPFDQAPVPRQQTCVVHPDAVADQPVQGVTEPCAEPEVRDPPSDRIARRARGDRHAGQGLCPLQGGGLGEMHDVDRGPVGGHQLGDALVHGSGHVGEEERHRSLTGGHDGSGPPGAPSQVALEEADVTQGRRHQEELCPGQLDQRHLPRPAPLRVGVVVELVHHHQVDGGVGTLAQSLVGQHLGGAADDRGLGIDGGISGQHAHPVGAEHLAQREELLRHQGLDRRGVDRTTAGGQGGELGARRDQALP